MSTQARVHLFVDLPEWCTTIPDLQDPELDGDDKVAALEHAILHHEEGWEGDYGTWLAGPNPPKTEYECSWCQREADAGTRKSPGGTP